MRDYTKIEEYLNKLAETIYPQPQDALHTSWASESINVFASQFENIKTVLDVGCGEGFCQDFFERHGIAYTGVCLGADDFRSAVAFGKNVLLMDYSFLEFFDKSFDLIYSRHSLEHSPFPLLTLMEWKRVAKYIALVLPSPVHWGYFGTNHFYVLNSEQWENLFDAAGMKMLYNFKKTYPIKPNSDEQVEIEYWYIIGAKDED